jgi:hypothetical protein
MSASEAGLLWLCVGLLAGISIVHSRALQRLQDQRPYDMEFGKIVAREQEVTDERD